MIRQTFTILANSQLTQTHGDDTRYDRYRGTQGDTGGRTQVTVVQIYLCEQKMIN
jgi:hypothetical protein